MIPVKLSLSNFMCYRDNVSLSFEGIHTACISGSNGSGKSTLIDAMTWALWGKARGRSDDELVNQGRSEMGVEFDFRVGEQLYRVIRKRSRPKRTGGAGQTILEFFVASGDGFRSIRGNTNTETDTKISNALHMDYETFVNSAFLRQGHADEFTTKRPGEQKAILADILRLSLYDELEQKARALSSVRENEVAQLESAVVEIDNELKQKPSYEAMLAQVRGELARVNEEVKKRESKLNQLRKEEQVLKGKQEQVGQLDEHISATRREISQWEELSAKHSLRIKEYDALISCRDAIEQDYMRFEEAKRLYEELNQKARQVTVLTNEKSKFEKVIQQAQQDLLEEHAVLESTIFRLEKETQELPQMKNELQQIEAHRQRLVEHEEALQARKQAVQELQTRIIDLSSGRKRFIREMAELEEKLKLLHTQSEAKCPLCETEVGVEKLRLIESKYAIERNSKATSLKSDQEEVAKKKVELESLEDEVAHLEKKLNQDKTFVQRQENVLNRDIEEAEAAEAQLVAERDSLVEIEERLSRKKFAIAEQRALFELEGEIVRLGYFAQKHDEVIGRFKNLQRCEEPKRKLDDAIQHIDGERESASRAEEMVQQKKEALETESEKRQALAKEIEALPGLVRELSQAETEYRTAVDQQRRAQETLGRVEANLEHLSKLEARRKEKEQELSQASKEAGVYTDLARAFGKGGIQALLIESALPEIEEEANRLLARMTDNRMHIKVETQRPTKAGTMQETFDINISDELGTRSYDMFSGGEAFRINFSIRIALSKLLARRAGAPLRTLIIDEGFGTLDSIGIEKIKEAITSIEEDFDTILVITHIEEFRDAFPTRIDVVKTAEGSTVQVN